MVLPMTRFTKILFLVFCAFYGLLIFPASYFRHDDWFNLGNSLKALQDPSFAFSTLVTYDGINGIWFFRPLFKIMPGIFYKLFGFDYYPWLTAMFALSAAVLFLGKRTLDRLSAPHAGEVYIQFFIVSALTHFGSLFWFGEGGMNIPQIFLLFASLYYWIKFLTAPDTKSPHNLIGSIALFITAIFFKEAFVFHTGFMFFLLIHEKKLREISFAKKAAAFLPFALLTAGYLVFRLVYLPVNPAYLPYPQLEYTLKPLGIITGIFGASFLLYFFLFIRGHVSFLRWTFSRWGYIVFFLFSMLPYLGHPFFSFGWLYSMAPYTFFVFGLMLPESSQSSVGAKRTMAALCLFFLFSAGTVLVYLQHLEWPRWKPAMQSFMKVLASADVKPAKIVIVDQSHNPSANFHRVIGNEFSVWHLWRLFHSQPADIKITRRPEDLLSSDPARLTIRWTLDSVTIQKPSDG